MTELGRRLDVLLDIATAAFLQGWGISERTYQRILYLFQGRLLPFIYDFELGYYGPFCVELLGDLQLLARSHHLELITDIKGVGRGYKLTEHSLPEQMPRSHLWRAPWQEVCDTVCELLIAPVNQVSLLAAMDYAARITGGPWPPPKEEVFRRTRNIKPWADDQQLERAWQMLLALGQLKR